MGNLFILISPTSLITTKVQYKKITWFKLKLKFDQVNFEIVFITMFLVYPDTEFGKDNILNLTFPKDIE